MVCESDNTVVSGSRPPVEKRLFTSQAVESQIRAVTAQLKNPKLARMFENCFPNTLDTTVFFRTDSVDGKNDTFVITGDIHAMWLRDSAAQVYPYVRFASEDDALKAMIEGVIRRQFKSIILDPYANAPLRSFRSTHHSRHSQMWLRSLWRSTMIYRCVCLVKTCGLSCGMRECWKTAK